MTLGNETLTGFIEDLSGRTSTPGGGAVAAVTGSQAAALISMVAEFSDKSMDPTQRQGILNAVSVASERFLFLADQDAENFAGLMAAFKNKSGIQSALKAAATPPLECLMLATEIASFLEILEVQGNQNLVTDTGIAATLIKSTITASEMNVLINLRSIDDQEFTSQAEQTIDQAKQIIPALNKTIDTIIGNLS